MNVHSRVRAPVSTPSAASVASATPVRAETTPSTPVDAFTSGRLAALPERHGAAVSSNNFQATLTGPNPPKTGGGFFTQLGQANELRKLAGMAGDNLNGGVPRTVVEAKLKSLGRLPLDPNEQVTKAVYSSTLPNASPRDLFNQFIANPDEVFGAAGLKLVPAGEPLRQNARIMIEDAGPPAAWMPVEVKIDWAKREIRFDTLSGHPLRGHNTFAFQDDGKGGAKVVQTSEYQFSSFASKLGSGIIGGGEKQHDTWKAVHAHLFSKSQEDAVQWTP